MKKKMFLFNHFPYNILQPGLAGVHGPAVLLPVRLALVDEDVVV